MLLSEITFKRSIFLILSIKICHSAMLGLALSNNIFQIKELVATEISLSTNYGVATSLFLIIILIPILEEVVFRGWLSAEIIVIKWCLPFLFLYSIIFILSIAFKELGQIKYLIGLVIGSIFTLLSFKNLQVIKIFIMKNMRLLIGVSIAAFTAIHLFNYQIEHWSLNKIASLAIMALPYPFMAYILTIIRIRKGLAWSAVLHILSNSLIAIPFLFNGHNP